MTASSTASLASQDEILTYRNSVARDFIKSRCSAAKHLRRNPHILESENTIRSWAKRYDPKNRGALADLRWFVVSRGPSMVGGLVLAVVFVLREMYYAEVRDARRRIKAPEVQKEIFRVWTAAAKANLVAPWNAANLPAQSTIREVLRDFDRYVLRIGPVEQAFCRFVHRRYDRPPEFRNYLWKTDSIQFSAAKLAPFKIDVIYETRDGVHYEIDCWATQTIDVGSRYAIRSSCYNSRPTAPDLQMFLRDCMMPSVNGKAQLHGQPKVMRFDRGGEHCVEQLRPIIEDSLGINLVYTPRRTPKLNSHIERLHRTKLAILKRIFTANPRDIKLITLADGRQVRGVEFHTFARRVQEAHRYYNHRPRRAFNEESPLSAWSRTKDPAWEAGYDPERIRRAFFDEYRKVRVASGRVSIGNQIYEDASLEPYDWIDVRVLLGDEHNEAEFHGENGRVCSLRPMPQEAN